MGPQISARHELPEGIAPGWYAVAFSRDVAPGKAKEATVAGIKMVVFRTPSGRLAILDRYCPHLGGDLTLGKVQSESIACPFHGWRFDEQGVCVDAPMCKRVPPNARVKSYPVHEGMECIFVYVGGERPYITLPSDEELFGKKFFVERRCDVGVVRTQPVNITRNVADVAHFHGVHKQSFMAEVANHPITGFDTPVLNSEGMMEFPIDVLRRKLHIWGRARLFGPGIWISWVKGGLFPFKCFTNFMLTPIDGERTTVRQVCGVCEPAYRPDARLFVKALTKMASNGVQEDMVVWDSIVMPKQRVFGSTDEQVIKYDRWYASLVDFARKADAEGC